MENIKDGDLFPTGTKFIGLTSGYKNDLGMQKQGTYIFPDGMRYKGSFRNNLFHGAGIFELPDPYNIVFKVNHNMGVLKEIRQMMFDDNLQVEFTLEDDGMSFDNWNYCTGNDRRFHTERIDGLKAVGSAKPKQRPLQPNIFDLGFGLFNEYGFLLDIPKYMGGPTHAYIGCRETRRWIRENCPHGELTASHIKGELIADTFRHIIENNILAELKFGCKTNQMEDLIHQAKPQICRYTRDQTSSTSGKRMRMYLGSTSDTHTSRLDKTVKREKPRCEELGLYKDRKLLTHFSRRASIESQTCHIN